MKKLLFILILTALEGITMAQSVYKSNIELRKVAPILHLNGIGATINFYNGDVQITHSSNKISISGGGLDVEAGQLIRLGTDTVTVKSYVRQAIGDTVNKLKTNAVTLHEVGFIHSDTMNQAGSLKLATQYWFTQNAGTVSSGGGSSVSSLSFITGVTAGAPTNGATTVSNIAGLVNKHIEVHKGVNNEGMKLLLQGTGTETFSYVPATGVITFNTALVTNDRVEIWATDVTAHNELNFTANTQLNSGLIAFWNLNETSGVRQDATLANIDLSPYATMDPNYRAGLIGNATSQTGVSGGYSLRRSGLVSTALASLNPTGAEYTVAFWYKLDSLPYVLNRDMYIFSSNISVSPSSSVQVYFQGTSATNQNKIRFKVTEVGNGVPVQMTHATAVSTTGWHSVVCTAQGVGLPLKIWHDGIVSTGSTNQGAAIVPATTTFNFGNYQNTSSGGLTGGLDMVGLWNRAWTQTDVDLFHAAGAGNDYPF